LPTTKKSRNGATQDNRSASRPTRRWAWSSRARATLPPSSHPPPSTFTRNSRSSLTSGSQLAREPQRVIRCSTTLHRDDRRRGSWTRGSPATPPAPALGPSIFSSSRGRRFYAIGALTRAGSDAVDISENRYADERAGKGPSRREKKTFAAHGPEINKGSCGVYGTSVGKASIR